MTTDKARKQILKRCDETRDAVAEACKNFADANDRRHADYDFAMTPAEQLAYSYLKQQMRALDLNLNELHYSEGQR